MSEATTTAQARHDRVYLVKYVPAGLIVALVLLRVAAGWHFWREGTKKLEYDRSSGATRVAFSAEPFLKGAVGPWADFYKRDLPKFHDWERLLATPKRSAELTADETAANAKWQAEYNKARTEAIKLGEAPKVEWPMHAPWGAWAEQVSADWQRKIERFGSMSGISDEQRKAAEAAIANRREQLFSYLSGEDAAIAEWQHELWRLGDWKGAPTAGDLPYAVARISEKQSETAAASGPWVAEVRSIEADLDQDLRDTLTPEQAANTQFVDKFHATVADPAEAKLHKMNVAVTCLVIGVGACLLLGLFTRLAALGGIAFLLMVMAAQPPWVAGARTEFFYYQLVEVAALGVLLMAGAGRWAGLDFLLRALLGKQRAATELPR